MDLTLLTCAWGRPALTERVLDYYTRLRIPGVRLTGVCVVSPEDPDPPAVPEWWRTVEAPNSPLGSKFNAGTAAIERERPDAVVILGSDDLLNARYFERVAEHLHAGADFISLRDAHFYDLAAGRLYRASPARPGAGRCLSASLIERLDWRLWQDSREERLDSSMSRRLRSVPLAAYRRVEMRDADAVLLDVKTESNMWTVASFGKGKLRLHRGASALPYGASEVEPGGFVERHFPGEGWLLD